MRAPVKSINLGSTTNLAVIAPIDPGFVEGFETVTHIERLRRLLDALHAARQNMRESELMEPVFPDSISRFGVIQNFRYAIWSPPAPPGPLQPPGPFYLTLNVTFDGGWEPYMRVIYRDIGPLLDALFCHSPGYPGSRTSDFDTYCRWVRRNELPAGLFYTDGPSTPADAHHLARLERLQRELPPAAKSDAAIAGLRLDPLLVQLEQAAAAVMGDPKRRLALPLRTLKGLYRLTPLFASEADGEVLRRFAQLVLQDSMKLLPRLLANTNPALAPLVGVLKSAFADELEWLLGGARLPPPAPERLAFDAGALQEALLSKAPATHGCVALFRVSHAAQARACIKRLTALCGPAAAGSATAAGVGGAGGANAAASGPVRHHMAFTYRGLAALEVAAERLDRLPQEFAEGMEARNGILGDVRSNHPNHWRRPLRHGAAPESADRIDLSVVHVAVVLRMEDEASASAALHPRLQAEVEAIAQPGNGLHLLAVEALRSRRSSDGAAHGHFGFADGLSQPVVVPQPAAGAPVTRGMDDISPGELLLGYRNDRGDNPYPAARDDLLDNGSFLVMRKLRQRVDHLQAALQGTPGAAAIQAKMMGRMQDGTPLVAGGAAANNAFDYGADPQGRQCPFQSHVRRSNPRDGRPYMPRLLRRGMSYGPTVAEAPGESPAHERGLVFMAYCASIAEQFETIQGWIAGANSSGISSGQADPFLGVPRSGEKRTFRWLDARGAVRRVDLGEKPFVELQWGLYLFAPSLKALAQLDDFVTAPMAAPAAAPATPLPADREAWRRLLEDGDRSPAVWRHVRAQPSQRLEATGYGQLVGGLEGVMEALADRSCQQYSVHGYGQRMGATMGLNYLGIDVSEAQYQREGVPCNAVIESISEKEAFATAWPFVEGVLARFAALDQPRPDHLPEAPLRRPVDLVTLSESVLAALCRHWFGLPDDKPLDQPPVPAAFMSTGGRRPGAPATNALPRCPGSLYSSSRRIFTPHPRPAVQERSAIEGPQVLAAVRSQLGAGRAAGSLTLRIKEALDKVPSFASEAERHEAWVRNISGMLLGFPPTVHGNFLQTLKSWIEEGTLWEHQQALAEEPYLPAHATDDKRYARAVRALRPRLMATMRRCPVPEMLWRSPKQADGSIDTDPARRVVLGMRSVLAEPAQDREEFNELMFGGSTDPQSLIHGVHACPGYAMGVGVLLALITGLLDAGTLRPTGSPVLLMLTPRGASTTPPAAAPAPG